MFLYKKTSIRLSKITIKTIQELIKKYPEDYKTSSDVIRSGIFALQRFKEAQEKRFLKRIK